MNLVVFDIDGCICPERARLARATAENGDVNWNQFHREGTLEMANPEALRLIREHAAAGDMVIFMTGRSLNYFTETLNWFGNHIPTFNLFLNLKGREQKRPALFMRPVGNTMTSPELKRTMLNEFLIEFPRENFNHIVTYDNRRDVLAMFDSFGAVTRELIADGIQPNDQCEAQPLSSAQLAKLVRPTEPPAFTAAEVLAQMSATFRERNAVYKDNAIMVGNVMAALFPNGITVASPAEFEKFHLFELMIVKLTRFVLSDMQHIDSVHDAAVYAAMIEAILQRGAK